MVVEGQDPLTPPPVRKTIMQRIFLAQYMTKSQCDVWATHCTLQANLVINSLITKIRLHQKSVVGRSGPRKLFWEGHIGLESPKTTKRDAEGEVCEGCYPLPSRLGVWGSIVSSPGGVWDGAPVANNFWALHIRNFVRLHACFSAFWNLTARQTKPTPSDYFCRPLVWRGHVPPVWMTRPWLSVPVTAMMINAIMINGHPRFCIGSAYFVLGVHVFRTYTYDVSLYGCPVSVS